MRFKYLAFLISFVGFLLRYPSVSVVGFSRLKPIGSIYSQNGQDVLLATLFNLMRLNPSIRYGFLDIGSNHPIKFSNSLLLERLFQIQTIAVDPLSEIEALWTSLRPKSIFCCCALGCLSGKVTIHVTSDCMHTSANISQRFAHMRYFERVVPLVKTQDIINQCSDLVILFASIDVEGSELDVLSGLDFTTAPIPVLCVENNHSSFFGSSNIRRFLVSKGYRFVTRIACLDDLYIHASAIGTLLPPSVTTPWFRF